ncbi:Retrovirus-related Pol polyprotein from transposon TNT 1-94 [Vitis vinifera]|uniref:Retrovirus-related Pol polyprotein from transposon TNT 1-94 n=1 Tax=Vitis vinifera TaxID=29760 RepID=A0A438IN98_VITVI|nr:Retrovirus-related Pol polyprotein from transposon TNT 1-94 [Vitis vinifera]
MKDLEDIAVYRKSIERQWVHIFLVGLDGDFEQSDSDQPRIGGTNPRPTILRQTLILISQHSNALTTIRLVIPRVVALKLWDIQTEANVVEKASVLVAATDYGDRSHPLDLPHKKLFPQPMDIQTRQTIGCGIKQGKLYYLDLQSKDSNKLRQALMADGSEGEKKKMTWLCLMKTKDEVNLLFKKFHKMIETQYNAKVRVLRSHNSGEYQSSNLQKYLEGHGIIHQTTCSNTPQQNGVAERKNRHLLEEDEFGQSELVNQEAGELDMSGTTLEPSSNEPSPPSKQFGSQDVFTEIPNQSSSVQGVLNLEPDPFMKRLPHRHNIALKSFAISKSGMQGAKDVRTGRPDTPSDGSGTMIRTNIRIGYAIVRGYHECGVLLPEGVRLGERATCPLGESGWS